MKRKVAVVLAAIMALSPISAFAATNNELTKQPTLVVDKTLFMEEGWRTQGMVNLKEADIPRQNFDTSTQKIDTKQDGVEYRKDATTDEIKYAVDGTLLELEALSSKTFKKGDTFKVTLSNASWFFRHNGDLKIGNTPSVDLLTWFVTNSNSEIKLNSVIAGKNTYTVSDPVMSQAALNGGVPKEFWTSVKGLFNTNDLNTAINIIANDASIVASTYPELSSVISKLKIILTNPGDSVGLNVILDAINNLSQVQRVDLFIELDKVIKTNPTLTASKNNLLSQYLPQQTTKFVDDELLRALAYTGASDTTAANGYTNANYLKDKDNKYSAFDSQDSIATYDSEKGSYFPVNSTSSSSGTYIRYNSDMSLATMSLDGADYILTVSESNDSVATVRVMREMSAIQIPLVSLSKAAGDVRVEVAPESNTSIVSKENMLYGQASGNNTKTTVKTKIDSKYTFYLDQLIIAETVPNSLQKGQIILTAPYGYRWADPKAKTKILNEDTETYESNKYIEIIADEDLYFADNKTKLSNEGAPYVKAYSTLKGTVDKSYPDRLVIDTYAMDLKRSGKTTGKLVIKGLVLLAEDYAPLNEEVKFEIRDYDGDTEDYDLKDTLVAKKAKSRVTKENVVIGNRKDWGVKFERISDITTLVSGRYEPTNNSTEFDKEHKVAKVKFSENVVASWWALRESEFTLTEGVKFRKVKIDDETNLDHTNTRFEELEGDYLLSKDRQNYVFLDATKLRIVDLEIERDKTASFTMQTWVSIEPGFEGDIEIKAGGNDILKETTPVVVAKAVAPITITSKVKDVKIGYQWQKVEDITLTETAAGRLKRDTELRLFIDDDITGSDSIAIAPDFVTEVNDTSNIKISKPAVDGGDVTINIERASYKTAATIKLSNVYVKIDRTVPESNKRPYKIVAGGTAIAANNVINARPENSKVTSIQSTEPYFNTKGIGVDYLNVVTSAPDKDSILSNIVTVKNGSNELKVGNETVTMDTEAYISAETNSMMVPVRFVAVALGISDDQVKWDDEARTVTIYNGARVIQFTLGKSEIIVNGVKSTIYSPDVPPIKVNVEVKDQRSFLPFRALGTALGVEVDYDATTQAAIYNYSLLKDGAKAATEAATETPAAPATTTPAAK